jgi:para-nitrobenzyl esterase
LQARTGHSAVYYYSFTQQPPGSGASHFTEMWYVFDHLGQAPWKPSQSDRHLAQVMSDYWVDFAKSGNPNGKHLPLWRPLVGDEGPVQFLGETVTSGTLSDLRQLKVFDEVYSTH